MNHLIISGHLGRDPEMNYAPSGVAVTKFSVAVKDYVGKDGSGSPKYETSWVNVVCFGKTAELCNEALHKGSKVSVSGRLSIRQYEKDGRKQSWTECVASSVELPARGSSSGPSDTESPPDIEYYDAAKGSF